MHAAAASTAQHPPGHPHALRPSSAAPHGPPRPRYGSAPGAAPSSAASGCGASIRMGSTHASNCGAAGQQRWHGAVGACAGVCAHARIRMGSTHASNCGAAGQQRHGVVGARAGVCARARAGVQRAACQRAHLHAHSSTPTPTPTPTQAHLLGRCHPHLHCRGLERQVFSRGLLGHSRSRVVPAGDTAAMAFLLVGLDHSRRSVVPAGGSNGRSEELRALFPSGQQSLGVPGWAAAGHACATPHYSA